MADRYFDLNGSTAGFGTLTGAWNTSSAFWSTSSAGTAVPGTFTFTNADRAFFGATGATATAGTATIADGITVTLNGITTANLAGLQTIARTTSGALAFAGTTPSLVVGSAGGLTISAPVALNAATTVNNSSTVTLSGQLTGTGTLTKSGAGDLILTGSGNTNSGNVTLSAGNTQLASLNSGTPDQLNGVTTVTLAGGTIFYRGNTATTIGHALTGSTGGEVYVRNTSAAGVTFSGSWSGLQRPVNIYADASEGGATSQTLTLSTNTATAFTYLLMNNQSSVTVNQTLKYTGTSTWTCGQNLGLFRLAAAGIRGILHNASSGNITWSGLVRNEVAFPVTFEIKNDSSGVTTISGNITQASSGALAVEKTGSGTATLTGNNAFTNPCNVLAGTLNANSATALGAASSTTAVSVTSGATLSLGAALNYSSPGRTTTISGTGVGGTAGALVIAQTGDVNVGSISLAGPTTIRGTVTGGRLTSSITGTQNLTLNIDTSVTTTLAGAISTSTGSLTKSGSGTLSLTNGTNAYSGGTTISAGTLSFSSGALGSSGSVSVSSAALQWLNANTQDLSARLVMPSIGGYSEIDVGANNVSFASAIGNSGSAALYKSGTGALTLTQVSTYTGLTTIAAGTLRAGTANALASSSQVAIGANTATLQTLTTGGQNGKLTVASLNNAAGGTIKIGG